MTALPNHKMTIPEFLAWSERQPKEAGRFELWDGEIIEKRGAAGTMNAQRSQHWDMKLRLTFALYNAVKDAGIDAHVVGDGASVPLPNNRLAEPDALVYSGPKVARNELVVPSPIIVCEVLSPSTARFDLTDKLQGYFELPSVMYYLIGDPDVPLLIHHWRGQNGKIEKRVISDPMTTFLLDPPGMRVDLGGVLAP